MTQTIAVSAGAVEYTWATTITETSNKDVTADTVQVSLGTYELPGTWVAPVVTRPSASTIVVRLLVGTTLAPTAGDYWLWVKVSDSPEVVPRRGARITIT